MASELSEEEEYGGARAGCNPIDGGQSVKIFSCRFKGSMFKESERNNSIISTSTVFTAVDTRLKST